MQNFKEYTQSLNEAAYRDAQDDSVKSDKAQQVNVKSILSAVDRIEKRLNSMKSRPKDYNEFKKDLAAIRQTAVKLAK